MGQKMLTMFIIFYPRPDLDAHPNRLLKEKKTYHIISPNNFATPILHQSVYIANHPLIDFAIDFQRPLFVLDVYKIHASVKTGLNNSPGPPRDKKVVT